MWSSLIPSKIVPSMDELSTMKKALEEACQPLVRMSTSNYKMCDTFIEGHLWFPRRWCIPWMNHPPWKKSLTLMYQFHTRILYLVQSLAFALALLQLLIFRVRICISFITTSFIQSMAFALTLSQAAYI